MTARAGQFAYDTMTLIGPGTWEAARAAADCALTAADLVLEGEPVAYACCRPPGHHATRGAFGGSCYLNNAAAAAARLRRLGARGGDRRRRAPRQRDAVDLLRGPGGPGRLRARRPGRGLVPALPRVRGRDRRRRQPQPAAGARAPATSRGSRRCPSSPPGREPAAPRRWSSRSEWTRPPATRRARSRSRPRATARAGRTLGELRLPTVVVQEGGYDLATLGPLVREALTGLELGR